MGLIGRVFGGATVRNVGDAVTNIAEVFVPNATRDRELGHEAFTAALSQHGTEFTYGGNTVFDRMVNGLNRLPRPLLALATLGLFAYSMVDPIGFTARMEGLAFVPEPLWWLLGAIVSFYFGARELHYRRVKASPGKPADRASPPVAPRSSRNPAIEAWRNAQDQE